MDPLRIKSILKMLSKSLLICVYVCLCTCMYTCVHAHVYVYECMCCVCVHVSKAFFELQRNPIIVKKKQATTIQPTTPDNLLH